MGLSLFINVCSSGDGKAAFSYRRFSCTATPLFCGVLCVSVLFIVAPADRTVCVTSDHILHSTTRKAAVKQINAGTRYVQLRTSIYCWTHSNVFITLSPSVTYFTGKTHVVIIDTVIDCLIAYRKENTASVSTVTMYQTANQGRNEGRHQTLFVEVRRSTSKYAEVRRSTPKYVEVRRKLLRF
jgi:hypothetical protein